MSLPVAGASSPGPVEADPLPSLHQQVLARFSQLLNEDERVSYHARQAFQAMAADDGVLRRATILEVVLASIGTQGAGAQET